MSTLLPCPFCGSDAPRLLLHMDESLWNHDTVPWERVICNECESGTRYVCQGEEQTATGIWNMRDGVQP